MANGTNSLLKCLTNDSIQFLCAGSIQHADWRTRRIAIREVIPRTEWRSKLVFSVEIQHRIMLRKPLEESSLLRSSRTRYNVQVAEMRKEERGEEYKGFERKCSRYHLVPFICKRTRRLLRVDIVEDRDSEQWHNQTSTQRFCP